MPSRRLLSLVALLILAPSAIAEAGILIISISALDAKVR